MALFTRFFLGSFNGMLGPTKVKAYVLSMNLGFNGNLY
jgi:hypothetical protein